MHRLSLAVIVLAAVGVGCGTRETQLVVVTYADPGVLAQIDAIQYDVTGPGGMAVDERASLVGAGAPTPPFTLALYPAGSSLGPITVTVRGLDGTTDIASRTARTSFVSGESRILYMDLVDACIGASCPASQTCIEGSCGSIDVPASALPEWTGTIPPRDGMDGGGRRDGGTDASTGIDGSRPDGNATDAPPNDDGGGSDGGGADGGGASDAGPVCDPGHTPLPTTGVLDYPGSLESGGPTFSRPTYLPCPSTPSGDVHYYEARTFCNPGPPRTFAFWALAMEFDAMYTLVDPFLVLYSGAGVPTDPGQCLSLNDDYVAQGSRVVLTLGTGEVVTAVATAYCAVTIDFCGDEIGAGTFLMRAEAL